MRGYTVGMKAPLLAALALLIFPARARAYEDPDIQAMLRAARSCADADARTTKEPDAGLYLDIAAEQYRAGDAVGARASAGAAYAVHPEGECPNVHSRILMARVQWESGGIAEASATMKAVLDAGLQADRKVKEECLLPLAELQSDLGDMEAALATAALIPSARKTDLFPHIAENFARHGRWSEAAAAADLAAPYKGDGTHYREMARGDAVRDDAYAAIHAAVAGNVDEALKIARTVKRPDFHLWWKITSAMAAHGRSAEAVKLAASKLSKDPDGHAMALIHIADAQEQSGDGTGAERTRALALPISAKGQKEGHVNRRVLILAHQGRFNEAIAEAGGGTLNYTIKTLCEDGRGEAGIKLAGMIDPRILEPETAERVVRAMIEKGDVAAALKSIATNESVGWGGRRDLLPLIAEEQGRRGDIAGALKTVGLMDASVFSPRPAAIEAMAQAHAVTGLFPRPAVWISALEHDDEKARAWLGAARGRRLMGGGQRNRRY